LGIKAEGMGKEHGGRAPRTMPFAPCSMQKNIKHPVFATET